MKNTNSENEFVTYDDNNLEHVLAGPDYGQPWGDGWSVETSFEYIIADRYSFNNFNFIIIPSN